MTWAEALALGFGMNARGSTEVIVASIGLSVGVLDQRLFSVIVIMAIVTTLLMPPTLRWALARLPITAEETERLKREEFEEDSYVAALERVLLVVDASPDGKLASAISGHIAGLRNMPVTVLEVPASQLPTEPEPKAAEQVRASSEEGIAKAQEQDETRDNTIHVETRDARTDLTATIAAEVEKGHDLLFLGVEPLAAADGGYAEHARLAVDAFRQSVALVTARGSLSRTPDAALRILVPVTGDNRSMRAIEFASLLAKSSGATVAAIYVRAGDDTNASPNVAAEAVFERVREIGHHYEIEIRTMTGGSDSRELAILTQARRGRYNLIVLGVARRAGDTLSLGSLADTMLESSDRSLVLFVTS